MRLRLKRNTMEQGVYYRRGSKSDFASVDMLPGGKDIPRIVIESISFHENISINGRKETEIFTAHFAPNPWTDKDFVLNSTNKTRIAKAHWNDKVEDGTPCEGRINLLKNIAVRLTKEEARDVQNGGTTYGLRISKFDPASEQEMQKWMVDNGYVQAPAAKKELPADKVDAVIAWAKKNHKTMADIEKLYEMSDEMKKSISVAISDDIPE